MLVGERTTAATRMSESADSAAMLQPNYALLPSCSISSCSIKCNKAYK